MAARPSMPLDFDAPAHPAYRALITDVLTPQFVRDLEPELGDLIRSVLADFVGQGGGDVIQGVALPIPLKVLARIAGFAPETVERFRSLTEDLWANINSETTMRDREAFNTVLAREVDHRRRNPGTDFVSRLLEAQINGAPVTDPQILNTLTTLAIGGHETTMNALSSVVYLLARDPSLQERLRRDEINVRNFVEEVLRFRTPIQVTARLTTAEVTIAGTSIPEGAWVLLLLGAANRDGQTLERADVFDPDSSARAHLAFGWGVHQCAGAALARAELRIFLESLKEFPPFRFDGPTKFSHLKGGGHFGPTRLNIELLSDDATIVKS